LNETRRNIRENNLKRMKFINDHYDKRSSYMLLNHNEENKNDEEKQKTKSKFNTMDANKKKNFKFKKMIGELPTLEKLKIRRPDLYKKDLMCIRCNKKEENIKHIWECPIETNNLVLFERTILEWLSNEIKNDNNIRNHDELLEKIYKYTRTETTLKLYNTEANTKFYRDQNTPNRRRTYIWDEDGSMDNILLGWFSKKLVEILSEFQVKKNKAKILSLLLKWGNKVNDFFKKVWKRRNAALIEWEKMQDINFFEKRKKNTNKKSLREKRKKEISGRKTIFHHTVDLELYDRVKELFGMNFRLDFQPSQDKRVYNNWVLFNFHFVLRCKIDVIFVRFCY